MLYELLTCTCAASSILLSLVKCSKANETTATGKTIPSITKAKENGLSLKEVNGKKKTATNEIKPDNGTNNNEKKLNIKSIDKFKLPENQDKFAQKRDPNYMTLNGLLDDCFDKTGEKLAESPKTETKTDTKTETKTDTKNGSSSLKEFSTPVVVPTTPQKPKVCGIAGSADPQYQTLNMLADECFEKP
ncbi:Protein of unknown function DUF236 family-containing protein [Strongyloides ratti]|uniref:Uncharacterized protein n=1 Tax=Strongyloides ratti TaxID=34506 RepID=A0A090LH96_STRRB|nr:Protein of unknown function DUF236 family-containing protein [Strongyloides ratti]CEF69147.1 Protein of unknown function DUF236 family-containing protein [Strongyloides ratti]